MSSVGPSGDRRDPWGAGAEAMEPPWPNGARLAVSIVVNIEEGAELSIADGDARNEGVYEVRDEVLGAPDPCMESHFAYGPRAGLARIFEALERVDMPATFSTCGRAAERTPWAIREAVARGHEISCHGWRWVSHAGMDEATERSVISRSHAAIAEVAGVAPVGWHTRSASTLATRRLLAEHGGFLYDSDAYDDDMPRVETVAGCPHVVLPYAFDTNDMRFGPGGGFIQGRDFADYCSAALQRLLREGVSAARLLSIGLHPRIIGRPGRIDGLEALLAELTARDGVWVATRRAIAECWRGAQGLPPWSPKP